ncbi:uncharacterized protein LOC111715952 [Eurytemora carolleeae]|uniref:uncharacterized protein LOC111715952 n=1 Tax=Eurytemora carolleeae TaxID=1294199 RepID=UPI000C78B61B|nr:uncharacterized protein LOC111715952 [Eurytemora carolleeae]|eukprot:XP_023347129.1 uncharacterized protein LOC111715952 [Eurytemora affinis]
MKVFIALLLAALASGFFYLWINTPFQYTSTNKKPVYFKKHKYILYYNQFWDSDNFGYGFGKSPFIVNNCSVNKCFITNDRLLLPAIEDFDMIIFHTGGVEVK